MTEKITLTQVSGITASDISKARSALQTTDIVDGVASTATNKALSAKQGKVLSERIDNVEGRGRFLSNWDCSTGLPTTNPETSPYTYRSGDYFIVSVVSQTTNYKPTGSSYTTGTASTVVETSEVKVDDQYTFDGTNWIHQSTATRVISFAGITGWPSDNVNLATALNAKQDTLTAGDGIEISNNVISATAGSTYNSLNSSQRSTLLSNGTYMGKTVPTNTIFETSEGKFEKFTDDATTDFTWTYTGLTGESSPTVLGYFNGQYIACVRPYSSWFFYIYTSTDLETWTRFTNPIGSNEDRITMMTYFNGKYIGVIYDSSEQYTVKYSTDLINWTTVSGIPATGASSGGHFTYSDSMCMYKGWTDGNVYTSQDGINWTQTASSSFSGLSWLTYANNLFIASGIYETKIATSPDGINWTQINIPNYAETPLFYDGSKYIIGGHVSSRDYAIKNITSTDLVNWEEHTTGEAWPLGNIVYDGQSTYITAANVGYYISGNGIDWEYRSFSGNQQFNNDTCYGPAGFAATNYYSTYKGSAVTTHNYGLTDLSYNKTQVDTAMSSKLANTATGSSSMSIGGTATSGANNTNIGISSVCSANGGAAIGKSSKVTSNCGVAVGALSEANAQGAVMIGGGVNNESQTFKVALRGSATQATDEATGLFTVLDNSGKIPAERLDKSVLTRTTPPTTSTVGSFIGQKYFVEPINQTFELVSINTKEPNGTVTGADLVDNFNGVMSNSIGNWNIDPGVSFESTDTYEIITKIYKPDSWVSNTNCTILRPSTGLNGIVYFDTAGKINLYGVGSFSTALLVNTWYWIKLSWNGSATTLSFLSDNNYTLDTLPSTGWTVAKTSSTNFYNGISAIIGGDSQWCSCCLDLNGTEVNKNGSVAWLGVKNSASTSYLWKRIFAHETATKSTTKYGYGSIVGALGASFGYCSRSAYNSIAMGYNSSALQGGSIALGAGAYSSGYNSVAIGYGSNTPVSGAIILGFGANTEEKTFKVALNKTTTRATSEATGLYTLLDSTGKIPGGRMSLQGTSAPTTSTAGSIGQFYVDTANEVGYLCVGVSGSTYTWKQITMT